MPGSTENPTDRPGGWHRRLLRAVALAAIALAGTGVAVAAADSTGTSTSAATSSATDPTGATTRSSVTDPTTAATPSTATGPAADATTPDPTTPDATTGGAPASTPAPAGFAASLITIYTDEYTAATELDSASSALSGEQLPAPSTFTQDVDDLTPDELSQLYAASRQQPRWSQLGGALSTVDAQARSFATSAGASAGASGSSERAAAAAAETGATDTSTNSFPPAAPTTTVATPPATFSPTQAVGATQTVTCPAGAPGGPSIAPGDDAVFAAQLTVDVANNVAADVSPTITIDLVDYPNPAKIIAEAVAFAGQVTLDTLNYYQQVASDCDTGNEDAFLANIDNTTVQLYSLESEVIQPTVDAIESGLDTVHEQVKVVQESVDEQLTIDIEQALSTGSTSGDAASPPNIEFVLPATDGGNLNSTPVGVQEVVTTAVSQAQSAGLVVNAMVTRELAAANDALSAGQYRTAYADYQAAYQGLG